jgi:hypothetical protein
MEKRIQGIKPTTARTLSVTLVPQSQKGYMRGMSMKKGTLYARHCLFSFLRPLSMYVVAFCSQRVL